MFGYTLEEERAFHTSVARGMLQCSVVTFVVLYFFISSPFGKTSPTRKGEAKKPAWWLGPLLPARASWFFFEVQNLIWSAICLSQRNREIFGKTNAILLSLFVGHYINRAIIYPLRMKDSKPVPVLVVVSATVFCTFNGYLQAQGLCQFQEFEPDYIYSLPFISGLVLFALGVAINQKSDSTLRSLRRVPGEYKIPRGGMFEYVSGAHYFGELLEWLGFALAVNTFSMQGVAFFVYTASNLIPRAVSHHVWYRTQFKDAYPNERKAVIPFLW